MATSSKATAFAPACSRSNCLSHRLRHWSDLPAGKATLDFSGALIGHVTEIRKSECGAKKVGTQADFYGSIYFQLSGTWYSLEMVTLNPLPPSAKEGYSGPGSYTASALLRD